MFGVAEWEQYYASLSSPMLFPNEFVVRVFLGQYPHLNLEKNYKGRKICDVGCGDGRNIVLLNRLGFDISATEISEEICDWTRNNLAAHSEKISADIREGWNWSLPYDNGVFDFLLSWNSCYYMQDAQASFSDHLREYYRVMKRDGLLVVSLPSPHCCTLRDAVPVGKNLIRINTPGKFSFLNGTVLRQFGSWDEIHEAFGEYFTDFKRARLRDDCFGLPLDYFVFVCRKRETSG